MTQLQETRFPDGSHPAEIRRPRLGFVGVGWIGRHRMQAVADSGLAEIAAVAEPDPAALSSAAEIAPESARLTGEFSDLLREDLDGIVIATPSALHAEQAIAALEAGRAVFCQKPLARTAPETRRVIDAARKADRLLAVDLSYRFVRGVLQMKGLVQGGELGRVYSADLVFHNAYGPDKAWFYDASRSGGGCVADLGIHLVDLSLWMFDFPAFRQVQSRLFRHGQPLKPQSRDVEDHALATWELETETTVRMACSWNLSAGQDAVIEAAFYGTQGAVVLRNVNGSFYDFMVERLTGRVRQTLASPPDPWGGRAILDWTRRLTESPRFEPQAERLENVAELLDAIYQR